MEEGLRPTTVFLQLITLWKISQLKSLIRNGESSTGTYALPEPLQKIQMQYNYYWQAIDDLLGKAANSDAQNILTSTNAKEISETSQRVKDVLGENYEAFETAVEEVEQALRALAGGIEVKEEDDRQQLFLVQLIKSFVQEGKLSKCETTEIRDVLETIQSRSTVSWDMYESTSVEWVMDEQTTSTLVHLLEKHVYKVNEIVWKLRSASAPRPSYAKSTSMAVWELLVPDLKQESTRLSDSLLPDPSKVNVKPFPDLHGLLDIPRPESIFHVHPRARVPQNDLLPGGKFHAVCKLFVHFNKQEEERFAMATGWLIDEDTVITAGHCAYKPSYGRATDIRIFLGYNGQSSVKTKEVQGRRGKYIAVHWGYFDKCQKEYDLAVIKTDKAFENVTGFLWQDCPIEEKDAQLTVVGYPGDTPANEEGEYMHYSEGKTTFDLRELDYMLLHHLDTAGGNSGGPIIHNNPQGGLKTIGVHCYGGQTHNLASALGHGGNVIHAFKTGLSLMEKKADGLQDGRINATGDPTQAIYRANISLV